MEKKHAQNHVPYLFRPPFKAGISWFDQFRIKEWIKGVHFHISLLVASLHDQVEKEVDYLQDNWRKKTHTNQMVSLSENASAISYVLITFWVGSPSYHVRVIFIWVSKLIWDWFGFVSLRDVIGPKNSRHPFNQSYSDLNRSQLLHSRFPACEAISFVLLSVVIVLFRVHPLPLPHKLPWKLASTQSHSQEGRGNVRRELTPWLKWRNTVAHASSPIRLSIPELEYSLYARAVSSPSSNANFK